MQTMFRCFVTSIVLIVVFAGPATGQVGNPDAFGPNYRYCKEFKDGSLRISVYAKRVTCKKARAIQMEYWKGPKSRQTVFNGGAGAYGYILLDRYPGWRCTSGSGGGGCNKGKASASYQNGA